MRALLIAAGIALLPALAAAQEEVALGAPDMRSTKILPLEAKILDLVGMNAGTGGAVSGLTGAIADLARRESNLTVREDSLQTRVAMPGDVLFAFDKWDIRPEADKTLAALADVLRKVRGKVTVEGHTDAKGDDAYNRTLSERRANAVIDWLVTQQRLDRRSFIARGLGETMPVTPNAKPDGSDDPDGRQKNRRVEFVFPKG